jgi:hypothetical protein
MWQSLFPQRHCSTESPVVTGSPGHAHGCPVGFFSTKRMALILLGPGRRQTFLDTEEDQRHAASE